MKMRYRGLGRQRKIFPEQGTVPKDTTLLVQILYLGFILKVSGTSKTDITSWEPIVQYISFFEDTYLNHNKH